MAQVAFDKRTYCKFFGSARGCQLAQNCQFNHSNPNSIPFCRYFPQCIYGQECRFRHYQFQTNLFPQYPIQKTIILKKKQRHSMSRHELLMHGYIRQIGLESDIIVPMQMIITCKAYCNSLVPGLLKLMNETMAIGMMREYMAAYFCDVMDIKYSKAMHIANQCTLPIKYCANQMSPQFKELCDIFYDEQTILPKMQQQLIHAEEKEEKERMETEMRGPPPPCSWLDSCGCPFHRYMDSEQQDAPIWGILPQSESQVSTGDDSQTPEPPMLEVNPLTSEMLQGAEPAEKKQMIGERLFYKIQVVEPRLAGKITGMLLEWDNSELLVLLTNQRKLMNKINEALAALKAHQENMQSANNQSSAPNAPQ